MNNFGILAQLIDKLNPGMKVADDEVMNYLNQEFEYTEEELGELSDNSWIGLSRSVLQNYKLLAVFDWKYYVSDIFFLLGPMLGTEFQFDESTGTTTFYEKEYKDGDYEPTEENFNQILNEINEVIRNDYNKELVLLSSMGDNYDVLLKPVGIELTDEEKNLLYY